MEKILCPTSNLKTTQRARRRFYLVAFAMNSCAEPDTVSTAAKKAAIVIRITSLASSLRYVRFVSCSAASEATR